VVLQQLFAGLPEKTMRQCISRRTIAVTCERQWQADMTA
jgi:hypothetical protein